MSYKTRYTARWDSEKFGHDYRVEILERDYTGEAEVKRLGASPVLRMDDGENGVRGTSLELSVQADRDGELTTLYTTDNRRFRVDVFRDGVKVWTGYVLPEQYAEPYVGVPYDVAVTATDGLGILKSVPFELTGERTLLEIIDYCCGQTGLGLDYAIQDTLRETRMSEAEVMHVQTLYKAEAFEGMNCHEVLETVMVSLDSVVTESECRWLVCSLTELEGDFRVYSPAGARKETGRLVTAELGRVGDEVYPIGSLDLEIVPAVKSVLFECDYGKRPSFLENYNFYHGKQGWTISSAEFVSHYYRNGEGVMRIRNDMSKPPSEDYWNSIEQGVRLESSDDLTIRLKCALGVVGGEGDAWNYRVVVSFTASDGKGYFLSPGGWTEEYGYLDVKGRLCQVFVPEGYSSYTVDSFEEVTILASGVPSAGVLSIRLYNTYMHAPATEGEVILFVSEVAVTNEEVPEGVDLTAMLNESASTDGDDTELWLLDSPTEKNGRLLYDRIVTGKSVGYTRAWKRGNSEEDSLMNLVVKSVCSRLAYPRRRLSGVIQGEELRPMMLVRDRWSGRVMAPVEASLDLVADEMSVTLEECMPFVELSGELDESERVTGGSSEYRSSGDNEKRVYQSGAGVPTRITDLQAETDPAGDDVMELDGTGWPRSKRVTLQVLAETFVRLVDAWTKGEMKLVDGYLTVLEQKIKAGWADDSDRWDGHEFGDWMDQPVRTGDGVTFRSVGAKSGRWMIDEEGLAKLVKAVVTDSLQSDDFLAGVLGTGFALLKRDNTGNSYLEIDKLLVRMKAVFTQLEIRELSYSGGNFIFSPAGMKCTRVVEMGNVYRCFFTADDGEVAVNNTFKVDDLVRMQEINIKEGVHEGISNRYFWRRCVGIGDNYIDLSMTDRDMTSDDAPKAGDSLVTLGNKTQVDRQNAIVISVFGEGSPSFIQYQGINDYTLDGKSVTTISPNGNVFTGDFIMKSGSNIQDEIDKTNQSVDQAIQDMAGTINLVKELEQNVGNLQDQIDGVIETWFYDPVPTLSNEPAVNWTTDNEKNNHLGDLYFDKDGKAYRFENRDNVYQWTVIPDTGLEEALRKAQQAQDTADGKRRIFTAQPTTESTYDVGDLWVNATAGSYTNDILRCKVAKTSGQPFSLSHWELASKYTDDTKANEAMQNAQEAQEAADAAQAAADKAQADATNAQNTADAAQSSANEANSLLSDIANDNKLTAQEKQATKKEWDVIVSEKPLNDASADKFGVSKTEYTNAYNALSTYITPLLQSLTTTSDISGSTFRATFKNYYDARTELLNNISAKAKELADAAQDAADVAQENADAAKAAAQEALLKAEAAQETANAAQQSANEANEAASNAQQAAEQAKAKADAANSELSKINDDGFISPSEKGALVQQQKDIQSEYADIISQANKYGVSTASYTTAYNSANTALTKYTATSPTHIEVGADYANIAAYYTARQTILDAISTAAKKVATDAQAAADSAQEAAEQAKQDAATAQATANDAKADAAAAKSAADAANVAISDLEANIEGAFSDGIISEAEAIAISKYTNQVNESFTSINATYTEVYGNVYLEGTAKTNLKTQYDALVTKKNALLNAISAAIADGKATTEESQAVDTAFTAYNSAVNSYQTALEQANEAIQAKIKSYADAAQESVDNLQPGGTNIIPRAAMGGSSEYANAEIQTETLFGEKVVKYTKLTTDQPPLVTSSLKLEPGQTYTASIYIKNGTANSASDYGRIIFYNPSQGGILASNSLLSPSSEWTQLSVTFTNSKNIESCYIYAYASPAVGNETYFSCMKVEVGNRATPGYSLAQSVIQDEIDAAMQEAAEAKEAADTARMEANEANDRLNAWASDSVISPTEKQAIKNEQAQVRAEKNEIVADAGKYSIVTTTYVNAFNAYDAVLTKYSASSPENITIGTDFNSTQTTYYAERTKILGLIADGAKKYVDDISIGMVNLLKESNVEKSDLSYLVGSYKAETPTISGKQYTIVLCYTLGENNTELGFYTHSSHERDAVFKTRGERVVESVTFVDVNGSNNCGVYQYPVGTYGSKVHWAVLVEGNKGPNGWIPSQYDLNKPLEEYKTEVSSQFEKTDERISQSVTETKTYTDSAIGNIKVGSVNLISKKMMLAWNEKNPNIAVWGQDADGVYLKLDVSAMMAGGVAEDRLSNINNARDFFGGGVAYKENTQYVFSVEQKYSASGGYGIVPYILYTDGSKNAFQWTISTKLSRSNFISAKNKTISKIILYISNGNCDSLIYAISLVEGNQIPTEIPEAIEDIQDLQTGSTNLITDRQNIITSGADYPDYTTYASELNTKGEREVTVTVSKIDVNKVYRYARLTNKLSEQVYFGFYVFSFDYKTNHNGGSINIDWRTPILKYSTYLDNTNGQWKRGYIICDWRTGTTQNSVLFFIAPKGDVVGNYVAYRNLKLVRGNRGWDDSPSPSDAATIAMEKTIAGINNEPGKITAFVSNEKYNKDGQVIESRFNSIETNVNGISLRVAKNEQTLSEITVDDGGVKIRGDKVIITGDTVFKDSNGNKVNIFGQGNKVISINDGVFSVSETGKLYSMDAEIEGKIVANKGTIGGFEIDSSHIGSAFGTIIENGMSLYDFAIKFKNSYTLAAIGSRVYPSSGAGVEALRLECNRSGSLTNILSRFSCQGSSGVFETSRNIAIQVDKGDVDILAGNLFLDKAMFRVRPFAWNYVNNGTIPTLGMRLVYVSGNTGDDNPCYLENGIDGQFITIANISTNKRINVKGTGTRDTWIREGECKTFVYLSGLGKWFPERFDW